MLAIIDDVGLFPYLQQEFVLPDVTTLGKAFQYALVVEHRIQTQQASITHQAPPQSTSKFNLPSSTEEHILAKQIPSWPSSSSPSTSDKGKGQRKYYRYHKCYGHSDNECIKQKGQAKSNTLVSQEDDTPGDKEDPTVLYNQVTTNPHLILMSQPSTAATREVLFTQNCHIKY